MENFKIDFGKLKVDQLGFVYKDIVKQAKIMENTFGFSKFIFGDPRSSIIQYRGRKSQITRQLAFSRLMGTQIELIKWINGDCLFKEFLDQGKEGLHHIAFYIENTDYYIKEFEKSGIGMLQAGESFNTRVTYMDTEKDLGFFVELLEIPDRKRKKE
ncbi:MAG: VOC family protein [Candidatus Hodarchaeota archaeon]